jgi:hypothetical protein
MPIIPPPKTAYKARGPGVFLKKTNATAVKMKGAMILGIIHCGSEKKLNILILKDPHRV